MTLKVQTKIKIHKFDFIKVYLCIKDYNQKVER